MNPATGTGPKLNRNPLILQPADSSEGTPGAPRNTLIEPFSARNRAQIKSR
jgi:hypothetical protein